MKSLEIETFVLGHDGVGTKADIMSNLEYLTHIIEVVEGALEKSMSEEEVAASKIPEVQSTDGL